MSLADLFIIAVGLSMDAFAVSICKGLSVRKLQLRHALICGVWFGAFQALMPLLGYWLGSGFAGLIGSFGHWVDLHNAPALALYRRFGYQLTPKRANEYVLRLPATPSSPGAHAPAET